VKRCCNPGRGKKQIFAELNGIFAKNIAKKAFIYEENP
jgi:hypothetical protein